MCGGGVEARMKMSASPPECRREALILRRVRKMFEEAAFQICCRPEINMEAEGTLERGGPR